MGTRPGSIQILLTTRVAKKKGPTSADDWNDSWRELNSDLSNVISQWNNRIVPLASTIPDGSVDVDVDAFANGLDGSHLYVDADTVSTTDRYYNSVKARPRTLKEQFTNVYETIDSNLSTLQDSVADITRTASEVSIADSGNLYSADNVETALAEVMTAYNGVSSLATSFDGSLFLKLSGRSGGQTAYGGNAASDDLTLRSTSNATKGNIVFGTSSVYDETNDRLGIGLTNPSVPLHAQSASATNMAALETSGATCWLSFQDTGTADIDSVKVGSTANDFRVISGGNQTFTVDNVGNVGIGTVSPVSLLHLSGTSPRITLTDTDTNMDCRLNADSGGGSIYLEADINSEGTTPVIGFRTQGTDHMTITNLGRVGMGTLSPSTPLHVYTSSTSNVGALQTASHSSCWLSLRDTGTTNFDSVKVGSTGNDLRFVSGGTENVTIDDAGNVGIGTTSPSYELDVVGDCRVSNDVIVSGEIFSTINTSNLRISGGNADEAGAHIELFGGAHVSAADEIRFDADYYRFRTQAGVSLVDVDSNGNVGIGTTGPDTRLEIQTASDEALPAVTIDQNDIDQPFIDFQGQASANATDSVSTYTAGNTIQGFVQIEINGVKRWIPFYDDPTS